MNRDNFSEFLNVRYTLNTPTLIEYLSHCLIHMECEYTSLNKKIEYAHRHFAVRGVEQALNSYHWPSEVTYRNTGPNPQNISNLKDTFYALSHFRTGLINSINNDDNAGTLLWAKDILDWGMGARGKSAYDYLATFTNLSDHLLEVNNLSDLNGDTDKINSNNIQKYNSGLSKVHSLASGSGLIIYDSRVAFTIGECINGWAQIVGLDKLPAELKFMQAARPVQIRGDKSTKKSSGSEYGYVHPTMNRSFKWLQTQMRASWLFEALLEATPNLWVGETLAIRMHKLEAAFFMLGAYAETITLPEAA